ncbi:MAG: hypothetical protein ACOH2H_06850 [Cypionkella sp.]
MANEKCIGNNVFDKTSLMLIRLRVVNPRDMWIRPEGAHPPIVEHATT